MATSRVILILLTILLTSILASLAFGSALHKHDASRSAGQQQSPELMLIDLTVTDKQGRPVPNLGKEAFTLFDGKTTVDISSLSTDDIPLSIAIVFDLSGSMPARSAKWFRAMTEHISSFVADGNLANEYCIVAFGEWPKVFTDWTHDRATIEEGLNKLKQVKPVAGTALYDACRMAFDKLSQPTLAKKVIILISDGQDNNSKLTYSNLKRALSESGILLYAIAPVDMSDSLAGFGESVLKELSSITGGIVSSAGSAREIENALKLIAFELRHQYRLGFRPNAYDGKWHSLRVKITASSSSGKSTLNARTRQGYTAVPIAR